MMFALLCSVCMAQETAKYRITYDCDARYLVGDPQVYRWTLDIGESTAAFYNQNQRGYTREIEELKSAGGDAMAILAKIPLLGQKYGGRNSLQVLIGAPTQGQYTYMNTQLGAQLKYEESVPQIAWQLADTVRSVCGYECRRATGTLYGRTWTVWYAEELPLGYGPYLLHGLPGLILEAVDADSLFHFVAVGLEEAPEGTRVELVPEKQVQKCSRKRYLEMRSEANEMTEGELVARVLHRSERKAVVRDGEGNDISNRPRPKKNFLDIE